ncbi:MAG: family 16 glycosylhydrolase [Pirellulales bacterium]|nr:family 16 glycosylhydrolase [Pirellulales bacterium]
MKTLPTLLPWSLVGILLLAARGFAAEPAIVCPLKHGRWELMPRFSDEFEGKKLDTEKWHPNNPTWLGRQPGYFSKANVTVADGKLHLTARREDLPNLPEGYHTFTTAAVRSKDRVLYGYFEIKCRPMDSRASSAFWFYDQLPNWWTEIDMFEIGGGDPERDKLVFTNAHVFRTPEEGDRHWDKGERWVAPFRLADGYHTYALEWNKQELKYYVDGQVIRTLKNTHWHQPLTMNFDSETMPEWFGLPKPEKLPSTFSLEYVRSWRQVAP